MELNGQHVFPLSKLDATWGKYFMNADGDVISTAMHAHGVKMMGSRNGSGHYVTLAGISVNLQRLRSRAKLHRDWDFDTSNVQRKALTDALRNKTPAVQTPVAAASWPFGGKANPVATAVQAPAATATARQAGKQLTITSVHADLQAAIKGRGFLIARVNGGTLEFNPGSKPIVADHDADKVLELMARQNPGVQFVKLQLKGAVTAGALVTV